MTSASQIYIYTYAGISGRVSDIVRYCCGEYQVIKDAR